MDLSNSTVKTPEPESETPTRIEPTQHGSSTNGVLKRHAPIHQPHHHHPVVVTYKECLKNFAAARGGHSLDGCGEFLPVPSSNPANLQSLICDVCGCHRNFHRRETEEFSRPVAASGTEYHSHNRHHPTAPPPQPPGGSPNSSPSPPPISSAYYPSAPHMLMALSHGSGVPSGSDTNPAPIPINGNNSTTPLFISGGSSGRKRFRTKFTQEQKGKMLELAEKVGWKMQKRDEAVINEFCSEIGVEKGVFKVWMHNNKNTVGKKESSDNSVAMSTPPPMAAGNSNGVNFSTDIRYQQQNQGNGEIIKADVGGQEKEREQDQDLIGTDDGSSPSSSS